MDSLKPPFIISIYRKPNSGKSYLMKYLLSKLYSDKTIDSLFVFTSTKKNNFYNGIVDSRFVQRYAEKTLVNFWKYAEKVSPHKKNILLVFDDCLGAVNWKASIVDEVFSNHRHNNVSILVATQYPNKLPTLIQEVSWFACIFKQSTCWSRQAIYDSYGQDYGSISEFVAYMNTLPKYAFLCMNTNAGDNSQRYKKMRAPAQIARFRFGNAILGGR